MPKAKSVREVFDAMWSEGHEDRARAFAEEYTRLKSFGHDGRHAAAQAFEATRPTTLTGVLSQIAEGLSFGFSDELLGGLGRLDTAITGKPQEEVDALLQQVKSRRGAFQRNQPGLAFAAEAVPGILQGGVLGRAAGPLLQGATRQIGAGAAAGALSGAGHAEGDLPARLQGAGVGALVGGATGALPSALGAAGRGLQSPRTAELAHRAADLVERGGERVGQARRSAMGAAPIAAAFDPVGTAGAMAVGFGAPPVARGVAQGLRRAFPRAADEAVPPVGPAPRSPVASLPPAGPPPGPSPVPAPPAVPGPAAVPGPPPASDDLSALLQRSLQPSGPRPPRPTSPLSAPVRTNEPLRNMDMLQKRAYQTNVMQQVQRMGRAGLTGPRMQQLSDEVRGAFANNSTLGRQVVRAMGKWANQGGDLSEHLADVQAPKWLQKGLKGTTPGPSLQALQAPPAAFGTRGPGVAPSAPVDELGLMPAGPPATFGGRIGGPGVAPAGAMQDEVAFELAQGWEVPQWKLDLAAKEAAEEGGGLLSTPSVPTAPAAPAAAPLIGGATRSIDDVVQAARPTAPFTDRVAVGDLFDSYKAANPGVTLDDFKQMLADRHLNRSLSLRRLDDTALLSDDLRGRSTIDIGGNKFHFVDLPEGAGQQGGGGLIDSPPPAVPEPTQGLIGGTAPVIRAPRPELPISTRRQLGSTEPHRDWAVEAFDEIEVTPLPTGSRFRHAPEGNEASVERVMGGAPTEIEWRSLSAAPKGSDVKLAYSSRKDAVIAQADGEGFTASRRFLFDEDGERYIENNFFELSGSPPGTGTKIFANQVYEAQNQGFKYITTNAAGFGPKMAQFVEEAPDYNGYYTWARLGYDSDLIIPPQVQKVFGGQSTARLSEIMSTPEGREAWRQYGFDFEGVFDLTPGSYSMRTLEKYLEELSERT